MRVMVFCLVVAILPALSWAEVGRGSAASSSQSSSVPSSKTYRAPENSNISSCRRLAENNPDLASSLNLDGGSAPSLSLRTRAKKCVAGVTESWADIVRTLLIDPAKFIIGSYKETRRYLDACNASMSCKISLFYEAYGRMPNVSEKKALASMDRARLDVLQRNAQARLNSTGMQNQRDILAIKNRQWLEGKAHDPDPSQGGSFWTLIKDMIQKEKTKWSCLTPEAAQEMVCYYIATVISPSAAAGMLSKSTKLAKLMKTSAKGSGKQRAARRGDTNGAGDRAAKLAKNGSLSNSERIAEAEKVLNQPLSPGQRRALIDAHNVGSARAGAGIGNYTRAEIHEKARILQGAGFTSEQRRLLMSNGIAGSNSGYLSSSFRFGNGRSSAELDISATKLGKTSPSYALIKPVNDEQFQAARDYFELAGQKSLRRGGDLSGARENFLRSGNVDDYIDTFSRGRPGEFTSKQITQMQNEVQSLALKKRNLRRDLERSKREASNYRGSNPEYPKPELMYSEQYINYMDKVYQEAIDKLNENLSMY